MTLTVYRHDSALDHRTGPGHPERPERYAALKDLIDRDFAHLKVKKGPPATEEALLRAHPFAYLEKIQSAVRAADPDAPRPLDGGDTVVSPGSWEAALHAAGAAIAAVDDIAAGRTDRAFCPMRPPGHHAEAGTAMGFCLLATPFIAARHAQEAAGIARIAIVDFDVHHGNGTDSLVRAHDPRRGGPILYISTHQHPLWPMSGLPEANEDYVRNHTLPAGADGAAFRALYERAVFPALEDFAPDLLILSAGFDAHRDDPLAGLNLEAADFGWVTERLCGLADSACGGRVLSLLEGGYDLDALRQSTAAHLQALEKTGAGG